MESTTQPAPSGKRVAYSVASLAAEADVSRQTLYKEISEGRLRAKRVRGRLVIPAAAVADWLGEK